MEAIEREELNTKLTQEQPSPDDRQRGFALVNVLTPQDFLRERIPGSINIPRGREQEFEQRFDKSKELIVYCGSPQCPLSTQTAEELERRGFTNVIEYEGGMSDWKDAGNPIERGQHGFQEAHAG